MQFHFFNVKKGGTIKLKWDKNNTISELYSKEFFNKLLDNENKEGKIDALVIHPKGGSALISFNSLFSAVYIFFFFNYFINKIKTI